MHYLRDRYLVEMARGVKGKYTTEIVTSPEFRDALDKYVLTNIQMEYSRYRGSPSSKEPVITAEFLLGPKEDSRERWIAGYLPRLMKKIPAKPAYRDIISASPAVEVEDKFDMLQRKDQLKLIDQSLKRLLKQGKLKTSIASGRGGREVRAYEPA